MQESWKSLTKPSALTSLPCVAREGIAASAGRATASAAAAPTLHLPAPGEVPLRARSARRGSSRGQWLALELQPQPDFDAAVPGAGAPAFPGVREETIVAARRCTRMCVTQSLNVIRSPAALLGPGIAAEILRSAMFIRLRRTFILLATTCIRLGTFIGLGAPLIGLAAALIRLPLMFRGGLIAALIGSVLRVQRQREGRAEHECEDAGSCRAQSSRHGFLLRRRELRRSIAPLRSP
jgi:hypothetical protein